MHIPAFNPYTEIPAFFAYASESLKSVPTFFAALGKATLENLPSLAGRISSFSPYIFPAAFVVASIAALVLYVKLRIISDEKNSIQNNLTTQTSLNSSQKEEIAKLNEQLRTAKEDFEKYKKSYETTYREYSKVSKELGETKTKLEQKNEHNYSLQKELDFYKKLKSNPAKGIRSPSPADNADDTKSLKGSLKDGLSSPLPSDSPWHSRPPTGGARRSLSFSSPTKKPSED